MDMATIWQLCLHLEYDRGELVSGFEEWLDGGRSKKILDAACGTGFPGLDLIRKGYDVTCTDGSESMLAEFRQNAAQAGVEATTHCVRWRDLPGLFSGEFDIVMCRGCSLIYADSWDSDGSPNRAAIKEAVSAFGKCLKPSGLLYVDTTSEENLSRSEPERNVYPERMIGARRVSLEEIIYTNRAAKLRSWQVRLTVDGVVYNAERHSCYLPQEELVEILSECGFGNIQKVKIRGEHYDVFTGQLLASEVRAGEAEVSMFESS